MVGRRRSRLARSMLLAVTLTLAVVEVTGAAGGAAANRGAAGGAAANRGPRPAPFTLVVLPDTQLAVQNKPELLDAQIEWIIKNRAARRVAMVVHVGDVVEWPSRDSDWQRATRALRRLDDQRIPYAISVGNHDLDAWACTPEATCDPSQAIAADRRTDRFNTHFPYQLMAASPAFVASHPARRVDNTAHTFSAGGADWLVLSLRYDPAGDDLDWADRVIRQHRRHQVIINTHEYQNGTDRSAMGERIWNTLVRRHERVRLVLSGHYLATGVRIDIGDHGNLVYQVQADYQDYRADQVNENGYLRVLEFDWATGTIRVRTFSPYCQETGECPACKTDPGNEFELPAWPSR